MLIPLCVRCITVGLLILEDKVPYSSIIPPSPSACSNHPNITISMFVKPTFIFCLIITTVQVLFTVEPIYA